MLVSDKGLWLGGKLICSFTVEWLADLRSDQLVGVLRRTQKCVAVGSTTALLPDGTSDHPHHIVWADKHLGLVWAEMGHVR